MLMVISGITEMLAWPACSTRTSIGATTAWLTSSDLCSGSEMLGTSPFMSVTAIVTTTSADLHLRPHTEAPFMATTMADLATTTTLAALATSPVIITTNPMEATTTTIAPAMATAIDPSPVEAADTAMVAELATMVAISPTTTVVTSPIIMVATNPVEMVIPTTWAEGLT